MSIRFSIVNKNIERCIITKERIINSLNNDFVYDENEPDIVFSVGGDGTFLKAIHKYLDSDALFIGINEGNLGFLCEFTLNEIDEVLEIIQSEDFHNIKSYRLLEMSGENLKLFALNEMRVETNDGSTIKANVLIDNDYLERYCGDGICFSTAIGSSGINKNLNGAVVSNNLEIIQISEKTPVNNKFYSSLESSLIVDSESLISIDDLVHSTNSLMIFYDNKKINLSDSIKSLEIKLSNKKINILKNENINYINKLNDAFIK